MSSPAELAARLGAATLGESGAGRMHPRMRPVWPGARISAPAFTVTCTPGDNLGIHVAVAEAPAGSVLCVDVGDIGELGYWGEVLTTAAEARGLVGLVIDGSVRDVDALEAHGFPVFSTGVALPGASKCHPATIGAGARVGDVDVMTGDWLVADIDGVVVIEAARLDDVLAAGGAREAAETTYFDELRAGATTVELLSLDSSIVQRGSV